MVHNMSDAAPIEFASAVLPAGCNFAGAVLRSGATTPTTFFTRDLEYLDYKLSMLASRQYEAYFAIAGFDSEAHTRRDTDVVYASCLQHDIDVAKPGGYDTNIQAYDGLFALVSAGTVPRPTFVVSSGGGLHVYWSLRVHLAPAEKRALGRRLLKALETDPQLVVDKSATTKVAPLLRWPGTYNWKKETPRAVEIWYEGREIAVGVLDAMLPKLEGSNNGGIIGATVGPTGRTLVPTILKAPVPRDVVDTRCVAVQHYQKNFQAEDETFHIWSAMMNLAAWTDDPVAAGLHWSSGPQLDEPRVHEVVARAAANRASGDMGPTSCKTLRDKMDLPIDACAKCPLHLRESSPAFLLEAPEIPEAVTTALPSQAKSAAPKGSALFETVGMLAQSTGRYTPKRQNQKYQYHTDGAISVTTRYED